MNMYEQVAIVPHSLIFSVLFLEFTAVYYFCDINYFDSLLQVSVIPQMCNNYLCYYTGV